MKFLIILILPILISKVNAYEVTSVTTTNFINDAVVNKESSEIYLSIGDLNYISIRDYKTLEINQIFLGGNSYKMHYDESSHQLFATLKNTGTVVSYNLLSENLKSWDISDELNSTTAYDVVYGIHNEIYVSGDGGGGYVARINIYDDTFERINNKSFRKTPKLSIDRNLGFLYVGSGFTPNSLYKVDLTEPFSPIIAEDEHGSIFGSIHQILSPNGTHLITSGEYRNQLISNSQIVRASSMLVDNDLPSRGAPAYSHDGTELALFDEVLHELNIFKSDTYSAVDSLNLDECNFPDEVPHDYYGLSSIKNGWVIWELNTLCILYEDLIFSDKFE